eukprot:gene21221-28133_t
MKHHTASPGLCKILRGLCVCAQKCHLRGRRLVGPPEYGKLKSVRKDLLNVVFEALEPCGLRWFTMLLPSAGAIVLSYALDADDLLVKVEANANEDASHICAVNNTPASALPLLTCPPACLPFKHQPQPLQLMPGTMKAMLKNLSLMIKLPTRSESESGVLISPHFVPLDAEFNVTPRNTSPLSSFTTPGFRNSPVVRAFSAHLPPSLNTKSADTKKIPCPKSQCKRTQSVGVAPQPPVSRFVQHGLRVQGLGQGPKSQCKRAQSVGIAPQPPVPSTTMLACPPACPAAMRQKTFELDNFNIIRKLYDEHSTMVFEAVHKVSKLTIALKVYRRSKLSEFARIQVIREITLHSDLTHPHIIGLFAAWKDEHYVYLALEWAPEGDLYGFLNQNPQMRDEAVVVPLILVPYMGALGTLHAKGLVHRDIKPENILVSADGQAGHHGLHGTRDHRCSYQNEPRGEQGEPQ